MNAINKDVLEDSFTNGIYTKKPLISIVIVVFNAKDTLTSAIESIINQKGDYELIIIDGGSNDGTVEIIKSYESRIGYWISEADSGIYDAMNKGIKYSNGQWIYFLGSDDVLRPGAVEKVQSLLLNSNEVLVYGDIEYEYGGIFRSHFSFLTLIQNTIHHQAAFYKRSLFSEFSYDTTLKIISDYELNLIIYMRRLPYKRVSALIAKCSKIGRSRDPNLSLKETNIIRHKHLKGYTELSMRLILTVKFYIMSIYRLIK